MLGMIVMLRSSKRAISEVVGYVLLISITIALSVLVYNWLRFYVSEDEIPECSAGVSVIIQSYDCADGENGWFQVSLKNKGRFTVDGYSMWIHDREGAEFGIYNVTAVGQPMSAGEVVVSPIYQLRDYGDGGLEKLTFIEVQPFQLDGDKISCRTFATQTVTCSS